MPQIRLDPGSPIHDKNWKLPKRPEIVPRGGISDLVSRQSDFQGALLPNSRSAITGINRMLKEQPFVPASQTTRDNQWYSVVATAVDHGARLATGSWSVGFIPDDIEKLGEKGSVLAEVIRTFEPRARKSVFDRATAGYLFLMGKLDPIARGIRPLSDVSDFEPPKTITPDTLSKWFASAIPEEVSDEILQLVAVVDEQRLPGKFVSNPVFGTIGAVAGCDADWICGNTLVELKCTVGGVGRRDVAQLICYAAVAKNLEPHIKYPEIHELALCLPRQSSTIVGSVNDWLAYFGAPHSDQVLEEIRRYFRGET